MLHQIINRRPGWYIHPCVSLTSLSYTYQQVGVLAGWLAGCAVWYCCIPVYCLYFATITAVYRSVRSTICIYTTVVDTDVQIIPSSILCTLMFLFTRRQGYKKGEWKGGVESRAEWHRWWVKRRKGRLSTVAKGILFWPDTSRYLQYARVLKRARYICM